MESTGLVNNACMRASVFTNSCILSSEQPSHEAAAAASAETAITDAAGAGAMPVMTPAEALEAQTRMFPVGGKDESEFDPRVAFSEMKPCIELLPHGTHPSCALINDYRTRFKLYYSGLPPIVPSAQPAAPLASDYEPKWGVWSHVSLHV